MKWHWQNPTSILNLISAFEKANNLTIAYEFKDRRQGDISRSFADVSLASKVLNWKAKKSLKDMCIDGWRWQLNQV